MSDPTPLSTPAAQGTVARLANELRPYAGKTVGSLRIGVDEVALIVEALDAFASLASDASPRGEAVAWRYRIGAQNLWSYCDTESDADFYIKQSAGREVTKQALYTHPPAETGASVGVKVKALEWESFWFGSDEDTRAWWPKNSLISRTAFIIRMDGDSWTDGTCEHGKYPNLAAAQAARQLEYETRILSALASATDAEGV